IDRLSLEDCKSLAKELYQQQANREELAVVSNRERQFDDNAFGWSGHLYSLLRRLTGYTLFDRFMSDLNLANIAKTRLLVAELALRAFEMEHDAPPQTLDELVPTYLPSLLADPFDANSHPLRYRSLEKGFVVYSVGPDGIDDS